MALANLRHGLKRRPLHLFDSFEGIPAPDAASGLPDHSATGIGTLDDTRNLLEKKIGYPPHCLHYHRGQLQDTVPSDGEAIGSIAILRLNGGCHASTKTCLEQLYPRVVSGGNVILNDYGSNDGCRKAVDEYRVANTIRSALEKIDSSCFAWIKTG
jgi:hypothetical protein